MRRFLAVLMIIAGTSPSHHAAGEVMKVSVHEQTQWIRHVIPLPHEIEISEKAIVPSARLSIRPVDSDNPQVVHAAETLKGGIRELSGVQPEGGSFTILLGILDNGSIDSIKIPEASRLADLPNNSQAYIIIPSGDDTLVLAALSGTGVYYAAATLLQLMKPYADRNSITVPLAEIVDWPDMEERGLWNFADPPEWIPWLSSLKLNYGKMVDVKHHIIERGQPNRTTINRELMESARLTGFNYCPFIMHYNFLHAYGLFKAYPEVAGVGDGALSGRYFAHKAGNEHRVPNASHPFFTQLLTEWMMDIAAQGAGEVSCWLSERPAESGDIETEAVGQFVMEARATVAAWREVRRHYPDFMIRIFISTTTNERYWRVLAETPPEVKLERCCATWVERVKMEPRDIYRNTLFDHYAGEGRWIASYDVPLGAYGRVDTPEFKVPCSSPHRIHDFLQDLVQRQYHGAYGMMAWANSMQSGGNGRETYGFNINALAEWSWNIGGRSPREFAVAWATREGYANPDAVGEWAEIMGPVEYDIYDSEYPVCYSWGQFSDMVAKRERPYLGDGLFRYYRTPESFDEKIAVCDEARQVAASFDDPYLANETEIARTYIMLARQIYLIAEQVATDDLRTLDSQGKLRENVDKLRETGKANVEAIRKWRTALGPEPWHYRVHDAIKGTENTVETIAVTVSSKYLY